LQHRSFCHGISPPSWRIRRGFFATQAVAAVKSGDFDPIHPGNELACLMANGSVVELALGASGWTMWDDDENAGWVVRIGDVDPESPETSSSMERYSDRIMMSRHNGTNAHKVELLFTRTKNSTSIGQVFSSVTSAEILGVDASGAVT
jgi:hypothetical protein